MKRPFLLLFLLAASALSSFAQFMITNNSLPNAINGQNYSPVALISSGVAGTVNWTVSAGSPPPGFVVGGNRLQITQGIFCFGTIPVGTTGGPPTCTNTVQSTPGSYTFTIQALSTQTQQTTTKQFTVVVGAPLAVTTTSLPDGFVGQPYALQLQATGGAAAFGSGQYLWSVFAGQLPPGFNLDSTGLLSTSSVTSAGTFGPFTVLVNDSSSNAPPALAQLSLTAAQPLDIPTPTILPGALQGLSYTTSITGAGGTPPYTWSLGEGNNTGLHLTGTTGTTVQVTGFPQNLGNLSLPVTMTDSRQNSFSKNFSLLVVAQLIITSQPPASGELGFVYNQHLTASGGSTPYTWTITSGALPSGLNLNSSTGVIQGTPTALGSFPFTLKLADSSGQTATPTYTIQVVTGLSITTASLPPAISGTAYSQTLTSTGGVAPISWSIQSGTPPAGISLNAFGALAGTATATGSKTFTVGATDLLGNLVTKTFTLDVLGGNGGLSIFGAPFSFTATVGTDFSQVLIPSGGTFPYFWTIVDSTLAPPGISIDPNSGRLQGRATTAGQFTFVVKLTDVESLSATAQVTMNVLPTFSITTTSLPGGVVGTPYTTALVSAGGSGTVTWTLVPNLGNPPAGIQLNSSTGVLSGTPTAAGSQTFTVRATDALDRFAQKQLTISIAALLSITNPNPSSFNGTVGSAFSTTITATGGAQPYTWLVFSGNLPAGLQLNAASGVISGTPTAQGSSSATLKVLDNGGQSATIVVNFTVNFPVGPPTFSIGVGTGTQPPVSVNLTSPLTQGVNGVMGLSFLSGFGGTDNMIRFSNGATTLNFNIAAGATTATFPAAPNASVIPGTVAGTITLQVTSLTGVSDGSNLLPSTPLTRTIVTSAAVPVITSVSIQQVTGGINVIVIGFSNTREISTGLFQFTVNGNTTPPADITVPLTSAYATWFSNTLANATGGQFKLTMPFTVTQGAAADIAKVKVTLSNAVGPSAAASSQ